MSVRIEGVSFVYNENTPFEVWALRNIDLTIEGGKFVGLIGPTGSGKTTLAQHISGLLQPREGRISVDGVQVKGICREVGIVFQSPEDQLFGRTVYEDMIVGYQNLDLSQDPFETRSLEALRIVGLSPDVFSRSPHSLSNGEERRVAIAVILILRPKILILDEPTLGLDPIGAREVLEGVKGLNLERGVTVILISHQMQEIIDFCDRVVVMDEGRIILDGLPQELFTSKMDILVQIGLDPPWLTRFLVGAKKVKGYDVRCDLSSPEEACREILEALKE